MNIKLLIEYDGEDFAGWQRQLHRPSIQASIEDILRKLTREKVVVYGAGRTDSGVHAAGQVANFHTSKERPAAEWKRILNHHLPPTIRILEAAKVPESFHAQKNAISKVYEYRVLHRDCASALDRRALHFPRPLDWSLIRQASEYMVGTHDYKSFQGARASVKTTVRTVEQILVLERGSGQYAIRFRATGFLKQMVRAMVGTLLQVGEKKIAPETVKKMIEATDRRAGGPTAAAHGLFLWKVIYPEG